MAFGETLDRLREERGISVRELARRLNGIGASTVGRWISGTGEPRLSELMQVSEFFGVSVSHLVGQEAPKVDTLADDELAILTVYRDLRAEGAIDRTRAINGLARAARPAEPAVTHGHSVMRGQAELQGQGDQPARKKGAG